jgi:hypothetical protein
MKNIKKSTGYLIVAAFWMVVLMLASTKTQAQTLCDSNMTYTIGSQYQLEIAIPVTGNSLPTMAPLYAVTYGNGNMLAEDSCFSGPCTHMIYNYNPNGTYYDTLETCISYTVTDTMGYIDTLMCCFEQYWDGSSWAKLSMQQQPFNCDSLSYSSTIGLPLMVYGNINGVSNIVDSIDWNFTACNTSTCYIPQGSGPLYSFPLINVTDTVKLCYDAIVYWSGTSSICNYCDSLIFDYNDSIWVSYSFQGNTVSIEEITLNRNNNNKIYDMLGRELTEIPVGKMYIRNRKLYITK